MKFSEIYVQDCKFYDDQTTNKTSQYINKDNSLSLSYSSNYLTAVSTNNTWAKASPLELSTNDNWIFEVECNASSNFGGIGLLQSKTTFISFLGYIEQIGSYGYGSPNNWLFRDTSHHINTNNWYKYIIELNNGTLYYTLKDSNDNTILERTVSLPNVYVNSVVYPIILSMNSSSTNLYRNIKIKSL